ncbi:MAG: hypothetical protein EOO23_04425 [Comamonadaceae bacterium]|nr:MAG: hypothetical protein EOO23_04425 [Comamonadaceae bacterium]
MPVPSTLADLNVTPGLNSPPGSESPTTADDYLRTLSAFIAQQRDQIATLQTDSAALKTLTGSSGPIVFRNRVRNGAFSINQRVVAGTVTLAAGAYGHDGWKGGAAGCTYTYSTTAGLTTITITAGSLIQVIEGANIEGGVYCMSWTGTATGKVGAGSYAASGVNSASVTGGANLNIEFTVGTLTKVQLEPGTTPTPFEMLPFSMQLAISQRYYCKTFNYSQAPIQNVGNLQGCITTSWAIAGGFATQWVFPVEMRAPPTLTGYNPFAANGNWRGRAGADYAAAASTAIGTRQTDVGSISSLAGGEIYYIHLTASAEL